MNINTNNSILKKNYQRTGNILYKKMNLLLLPAVLTSAATSLNEFVDTILVSNLLGDDAMAVTSLTYSVMLFFGTIQFLLGYGGSIVYTRLAGSMKNQEAEDLFSKSFWAFVFAGFAVGGIGLAFLTPISQGLCNDASLLEPLKTYLVPLFLAAPMIIFINSFSSFLPVFGMPNLSMALVMIANVVNLFMDYAYIRFFHMDVEGAGWATFTGYAVACLFLLLMVLTKKCRFRLKFLLFRSFREFWEILLAGLPQAACQTCYAIQSIYFNNVALSLGGEPALLAFSLQTQIMNMISVALCGVGETLSEFMAILHSQNDNAGIRYLMKRSLLIMSAVTVSVFALLQVWPESVLYLYGITEEATVGIARTAVRIFSVTYIFRSITILLRNYLNASGYDYYAMGISITDSLAGLLLCSAVLIPTLGLTGLWMTYPVNACLLMIAVLIINLVYSRTHRECKGLLLLKEPEDCLGQLNITLTDESKPISEVSEQVQHYCEDLQVNHPLAINSGLLVEEMCLFFASKNRESIFVDVLLRIYLDTIQIDFRSLGVPANPLTPEEHDHSGNTRLLQHLPSKLEYNYSLGMNSAKMTINRPESSQE